MVGCGAPHTLFAFRFVGNFVTLYRIDVPYHYVKRVANGKKPKAADKLIILRFQGKIFTYHR